MTTKQTRRNIYMPDKLWRALQRAAAQARFDAETEALIQGRLDKAKLLYQARTACRPFNGGSRATRAKIEAERAAAMNENLSSPGAAP